MSTFTPSRYQQDIFDEIERGKGDVIVNACAGSGKTKTIEEAVNRLDYYARRRILLTAFNNHIKAELAKRQKDGKIPAFPAVQIYTLHGLGYSVLRDYFKPADTGKWVDEYKLERLVRAYWLSLGLDDSALKSPSVMLARDATAQLANLAALTLTDPNSHPALFGLLEEYDIEIPAGKTLSVLQGVGKVLEWTAKGLTYPDSYGRTYHPKECISFTDMIYLPLVLNLSIPQYDLLFVDECQDLSRAQQELILRAKSPRSRAVWCGDPKQAIYSFMGADSRSFDRIAELTEAKKLPLSICYRCSRKVVELAQQFVPQIECAPNAPEGEIFRCTEDRLLQYVFSHAQTRSKDPFMILCRVNAPLIQVALQFLARGVPVHVRGRDIGAGMNKLIDQLADRPGFAFSEFIEAAEDYRDEQTAILRAKRAKADQIINLGDRVDSVIAIYQASVSAGRRGVEEMKAFIKELFSDKEEAITLSSIHKAKGLEADRVGLLRPDLLPHPKADTPAQLEQERNLAYVAITRARQELYIAGWMGFETQPDEEEPEIEAVAA
jgi:superfamily I DNA/RNA helicase